MMMRSLNILVFLLLVAKVQGNPPSAKPFFRSMPSTRVELNTNYEYAVDAADSTGPVSNIAVMLPTWLRYDEATRKISGVAKIPGQYNIRLIASNRGVHADQYYTLTVFDNNTKNILCLGNSITNGTDKYNSYRRPLWKILHRENYNFDFIGSWDKHHMGRDVPDPDFDMDHEGHSGWTANHVFQPPDWDTKRGEINSWLTQYMPDVVLVELGTNDVFQCRTPEQFTQDITALVGVLRAKNPNVKIAMSLVMPLGKKWTDQNLCKTEAYGQIVLKMNAAIRTFAPKLSTDRSPITIVDIYSGMMPDKYMYDDIHPNDAGEIVLAEKYYAVIKKYLTRLK